MNKSRKGISQRKKSLKHKRRMTHKRYMKTGGNVIEQMSIQERIKNSNNENTSKYNLYKSKKLKEYMNTFHIRLAEDLKDALIIFNNNVARVKRIEEELLKYENGTKNYMEKDHYESAIKNANWAFDEMLKSHSNYERLLSLKNILLENPTIQVVPVGIPYY